MEDYIRGAGRASVLRFLFLLIPALIIPAPAYSSGRIPRTLIRVNLFSSGKVLISSDENFRARCLESGRKTEFPAGWIEVLPSADGGLTAEGRRFAGGLRFQPRSGILAVNGRRYRGDIAVVNAGGLLNVINEVDIENYLPGVLPVEVSPEWPEESLKAQAVVSRTYVLNNLGKYGDRGYDLTADVFSQVYGGMDVEHPASNKAVKETAGLLLSYDGVLARAYFHSCCGGYTEDISRVWGSSLEYMRGADCPYCQDSPRYNWHRSILPSAVRRRLETAGEMLGEVQDIRLMSRTAGGRVDLMEIIHSEGTLSISGHRFRMALGHDYIKSAMFAIDRSADKFRFYGRGWGHGVGMCQWGARGQAIDGKSFIEILEYYFPGVRVRRL